ncbi:MAG TPA: hypothetical protein DD727_07430 [Clostridiales bacterium]|nr:hypothetical protein [Clostridiales bacterium]
MVDIAARQLISVFVKNGIVKKEEEELYAYGMELFLAVVMNLTAVLLLSIILNNLLPTLVFLAGFIPVRRYAGGAHARSHFLCLLLFLMAYWIFWMILLIVPHGMHLPIALITGLLSVQLIFVHAPVESSAKPLDSKRVLKFKKRSRQISILFLCIQVAGCILFPQQSLFFFSLSLGLLTASVSLWAGTMQSKLKERRCTHEKS